MQFRYHNDMKIVTTSGRHAHLSVSNHVWGSKLKIRGVYTLDSGLYRCEASNGLRRVHTSAYLTISFRKYIFPALSCGFECASAEMLHHRTPAGMGNRGKSGHFYTNQRPGTLHHHTNGHRKWVSIGRLLRHWNSVAYRLGFDSVGGKPYTYYPQFIRA